MATVRNDLSAPQRLPGKATLLYVLRGASGSIDVGRQELEQIKRLAKWYGVEISTRALGHGGYRVSRPAPRASAAA